MKEKEGNVFKFWKLETRVHNHPGMEKKKGLDENHVIIDKELYLELVKRFGSYPVPLL